MADEETRQMQMERIKNISGVLYTAIIERYKILPLICTLSAALVGLLFQDTNLIKTHSLAIFAFIIFLSLIPLSIFCLLSQLERDIGQATNKIEEIVENKPSSPQKNNHRDPLYLLLLLFSTAIILFILSLFKAC